MPGPEGPLLAGRYRLVGRLGRGGMGVVWRARDEMLRRDVAVKEVLLAEGQGGEEREERLRRTLREARAAAGLNHPGIVTVHDVVEEDGRPWIVMELIEGPSLDGLIAERGPLPERRAAAILLQVLEALRAAHAAGVLHRDVKPANVLLSDPRRARAAGLHPGHRPPGTRPAGPQAYGPATGLRESPTGSPHTAHASTAAAGMTGMAGGAGPDHGAEGRERVVLTDFGIALAEYDSTLTGPGSAVGSLEYMAPEQFSGGRESPASDLWALGVTLYKAVEGVGPFHRANPTATVGAILSQPPRPPLRAALLWPVIDGLLRKNPAERLPADAVTRLLAQVAYGEPPAPARRARSRRGLVIAAGALAVAVAASAAVLLARGVIPWPGAARSPSPGPTAAGGHSPAQGTPAPGTSGQGTSAPSSAAARPSGASDSGPAPPGAVPPGFTRFEKPGRFSLAVPAGWRKKDASTNQETSVEWRGPEGSDQRLWTVQVIAQPLGLLESADPRQILGSTREGFERKGAIETLRFREIGGEIPGAEWEAVISQSGTGKKAHVYSRLLVIDRRAAVLLFTAPHEDWPRAASHLAAFTGTFTL
ncbi:serine/threonine-protein kinase [Bailinhaonella thermotolerans]|uniref:non-specific serine/threonine protein kinase n=1 Tax=Bailinhaonella thermotolerans TaxID=1070861 RepID=A0A3A4AT89_9ACTN|nr:serine/threonine-protein kinase [Bailinhaonella thermotolerans]RJL32583.1 serine/threonine protein kinase [Bailinhaonella thermotolerans]